MPMSKNTGMPKIRPIRPIASGAPLRPNSFSSRVVSTSAPPERSRIAPSTVPRPMISAMCPRMPPKPVSSRESPALSGVPTSSVDGEPAASADGQADDDQGDERFELDLDDQEQQHGDARARPG